MDESAQAAESYILDVGRLKRDLLDALAKSGICGSKAEHAAAAAIMQVLTERSAH